MADRFEKDNARVNAIATTLRDLARQYDGVMVAVMVGVPTDDPDQWLIGGASTTSAENTARLLTVGYQTSAFAATKAQGNG